MLNGCDVLTIFIPSYNRRHELSRALDSIFDELSNSKYGEFVRVLVVDDFSTENIDSVIAAQRARGREIDYRLHPEKCGVAEVAMFSCLQFIDTKYAWLIGNDDELLPGSLDYLYDSLLEYSADYYLLNFLGKKSCGSYYYYYKSDAKAIKFSMGAQLFSNFGFATATTTFPCLCFNVDLIKAFDYKAFSDLSPIYSHSFSMFCAFSDRPSVFLPKPLVFFNHNDAIEEHEKLSRRNNVDRRTSYYHVSTGYIRHLVLASRCSGISLDKLSLYREDELDKNNDDVRSTLAAFFAFNACLTELMYEIEATLYRVHGVTYATVSEIDEQQMFFEKSGIPDLAHYFTMCRKIYCSFGISPADKVSCLLRVQERVRDLSREYLARAFCIDGDQFCIELPFGMTRSVVVDESSDMRVFNS